MAGDYALDERLQDIDRRLAGASPSPWLVNYNRIAVVSHPDEKTWHDVACFGEDCNGGWRNVHAACADAEFIAAARQDIEYLLDKVVALQKEVATAEGHPHRYDLNANCEECSEWWRSRT